MSADEAEHLVRLLYRHAETELDQSDNWRLDTEHGPVYLSMSRRLPPDCPAQAFDPVPRPGPTWQTGRFADVSGVEQVASREDLQRVVAQMRADLAGSGWREWENPTLDRFLDAIEGVVDGLPSQELTGAARPYWALVARILVAATGYE
jgi:hypothetical protein